MLVSFSSLRHIFVLWSRLREDPLPCLQAVPNLARLIFVNACVGKQLCFLDGLQKLKILNTYNCNQLNEIVLEKGVMPSLQILSLGRCMKLKALPHGIDIHNC
jgi:disease resistance protein RPM1